MAKFCTIFVVLTIFCTAINADNKTIWFGDRVPGDQKLFVETYESYSVCPEHVLPHEMQFDWEDIGSEYTQVVFHVNDVSKAMTIDK